MVKKEDIRIAIQSGTTLDESVDNVCKVIGIVYDEYNTQNTVYSFASGVWGIVLIVVGCILILSLTMFCLKSAHATIMPDKINMVIASQSDNNYYGGQPTTLDRETGFQQCVNLMYGKGVEVIEVLGKDTYPKLYEVRRDGQTVGTIVEKQDGYDRYYIDMYTLDGHKSTWAMR